MYSNNFVKSCKVVDKKEDIRIGIDFGWLFK